MQLPAPTDAECYVSHIADTNKKNYLYISAPALRLIGKPSKIALRMDGNYLVLENDPSGFTVNTGLIFCAPFLRNQNLPPSSPDERLLWPVVKVDDGRLMADWTQPTRSAVERRTGKQAAEVTPARPAPAPPKPAPPKEKAKGPIPPHLIRAVDPGTGRFTHTEPVTSGAPLSGSTPISSILTKPVVPSVTELAIPEAAAQEAPVLTSVTSQDQLAADAAQLAAVVLDDLNTQPSSLEQVEVPAPSPTPAEAALADWTEPEPEPAEATAPTPLEEPAFLPESDEDPLAMHLEQEAVAEPAPPLADTGFTDPTARYQRTPGLNRRESDDLFPLGMMDPVDNFRDALAQVRQINLNLLDEATVAQLEALFAEVEQLRIPFATLAAALRVWRGTSSA